MKEAVWILLAVTALSSQRGRPMTILLLGLWFYSYAFVFFVRGHLGYQAATWVTFATLILAVLLILADGRSWATIAVAALLLVSFLVQAAYWTIPILKAEYAVALYHFGTAIFTLQLGLMAIDALSMHFGAYRRRRKRRALSA